MTNKLKLKNYRDVHKDFRIDGVSPNDLRELWKEAQKERDEWWLELILKLDDKTLTKLVEESFKEKLN